MLKKLHYLLALTISALPLFAAEQAIDFGKYPSIESGFNVNLNEEFWREGAYAFNHAPELISYFAKLKQKYKIDTIVETGTYKGGTTVVFADLFDAVHTIEIVPDQYLYSKNRLSIFPNVTCHLGSSEKVLQSILPALANQRVLFYLDAHWESYWPLLDELEEINRTHHKNCIIVIDDCKVPGREDIPFDAYKSHECSLEYVKEKLDQLFRSYEVVYLIPKSVYSRAKLVVIPNKWR
jgi:cephalosporin hydroxylase